MRLVQGSPRHLLKPLTSDRIPARTAALCFALSALGLFAGCTTPVTGVAGSGGTTAGTGGHNGATGGSGSGGSAVTTGSGGFSAGSGGQTAGTGGSSDGTGGGSTGSGGSSPGTGGAASGGSSQSGSGGVGGGAATGGQGAGGGQPDGGVADGGSGTGGAKGPGKSLDELKQAFIDLRFGMFIHFGILTYTGSWAQANLDITKFNPTKLDPNQWATAAVSAKMKFGVLTTRHHDGFALWPSAAGTFNVGHIPWRSGKGDVVKEYVDAFRSHGLLPGLYYSIWDATNGPGGGGVTPAQVSYIKTQLTELLTNYGEIPILVFDGWSWMMGHRAVAYQEIHDLVKSLQPNILITDHHGILSPWDEDLVMFEEPRKSFAPAGNTYAAVQGNKINSSGGNDWFWKSNIGGLRSASYVVTDHLKVLEPRYTNFILNCPPNQDGLMDAAIVSALASYGAAWTPNANRAPLPPQGVSNDYPYMPASATATSGTAASAIDGRNDLAAFTVWQSSTALPQSITLDLGQSRPDVGLLGYLPPYTADTGGPLTAGTITDYTVSVSADNSTFNQVATGTWPLNANLKYVTWTPGAARYIRLTATAANSGYAAATELVVGARR